MNIRKSKKWALLPVFWVALQTQCLQADQTITGSLTVTGVGDIQGNTLSLGTRTDNLDAGWWAGFIDGSSSVVEFDANRSANIWKWQQNGGATPQLQMSLDNNNVLVLYDHSSTPVSKVTLNPLGTSTFSNSITLNGTDNQMPNQILTGDGSVLTQSLGDARYMVLGANGSVSVPGIALGTNGAGTVTAPDGTDSNGGNLSFNAGNGNSSDYFTPYAGGSISFAAGNSYGSYYYSTGGNFSIDGGNGGGGISMAAGSGGDYDGARIALASGPAGGNASIYAGNGYAWGSDVLLQAGYTYMGDTIAGGSILIGGSRLDISINPGLAQEGPGNILLAPNTGNIGIGLGTSSPSAKLDVNGDTRISGTLSVSSVITAAPGGDIPMFSGN